jgi:hypothetical protein
MLRFLALADNRQSGVAASGRAHSSAGDIDDRDRLER